MVQIKIKGLKNAYHVIAMYDDENAFFELLKQKLQQCLEVHSGCFEAFFHVPSTIDIVRLFQICKECHTVILGVHTQPSKKNGFQVVETDLRGGEQYQYYEPVILLGNIHKLAYVTSTESIYVMGNAMGNIDLLHEDCVLCASYINANVRICDSAYQNMTSFSPSKVYYEKRKLGIIKYKEELQWEKL